MYSRCLNLPRSPPVSGSGWRSARAVARQVDKYETVVQTLPGFGARNHWKGFLPTDIEKSFETSCLTKVGTAQLLC